MTNKLEMLNLAVGLSGGISGVLGGLLAFASFVESHHQKNGKEMNRTYTLLKALVGGVAIFLSAFILVKIAVAEPVSLNERLTTEAWTALNHGDNDLAIEKALQCVGSFQDDGLAAQKILVGNGEPPPPEGKTTPLKKQEILSRGILNDVATCWYIIGTAEMQRKNKEKAMSAFERCRQFSYARTYDLSWDGFWSPAKKAETTIKALSGQLY
jgi:hypothetical protein